MIAQCASVKLQGWVYFIRRKIPSEHLINFKTTVEQQGSSIQVGFKLKQIN